MQLVKEGGKWELFLPRELGYDNCDAGSFIPGGEVLVRL
jgi:FKBP-type peptidyl-prolyl cis-trans isomerase